MTLSSNLPLIISTLIIIKKTNSQFTQSPCKIVQHTAALCTWQMHTGHWPIIDSGYSQKTTLKIHKKNCNKPITVVFNFTVSVQDSQAHFRVLSHHQTLSILFLVWCFVLFAYIKCWPSPWNKDNIKSLGVTRRNKLITKIITILIFSDSESIHNLLFCPVPFDGKSILNQMVTTRIPP